MNFIKLILKRPIAALLIVIALVFFGISALCNIRLEYFPDMEMPMQVIVITYPGADAESVEKYVTQPLEDVGKTLADIDSIESTSYDNYCTAQFSYNYGTDLDDAYLELSRELEQLQTKLPSSCGEPSILEISLDTDATISIAAKSDNSETDLLSYVKDNVVPVLEGISDVEEVSITGDRDEYMRIVVNEEKLKQYGISLQTIANTIAGADFNMPIGDFTLGSQNIGTVAKTEIDWQYDMMDLSVKIGDNALIPLRELVDFSNLVQEEPDSISRFNGNNSIIIDVTKKKSAGTMDVCQNVEKTISQFTACDIEFEVIQSSADNISDSLIEVVKTLIEGVLFSMLILFLFFGDMKASLIVGCSMPLSLLCSLILLHLFGISFDLMTGTGMIIAIGMIVDNSIVILENCFRQKKKHSSFVDAAAASVSEMMLSVFASTLTTVVVYAPMLTTKGMSAQMNMSMCVTVIFTMVASLVSAITVVPLLFCLVKPIEKKNLPINRILHILENLYQKIIPVLLHAPKRTIGAAVILFAISILMATGIHMDLFPSNYDGSIQVEATFRPATQMSEIDTSIQKIEQMLINDSAFSSVELSIQDNVASLTAFSAEKNKRSSEDAVEYYIDLFSNITDMDIAVTPYGVSTGLTSLMSTGNDQEISLYGDDMEHLKEGAALITQKLRTLPGIIHVKNDIAQEKSTVSFVIDQHQAANAGLTPSGVATQIYGLVNGITATTLTVDDEDYKVIVEYPVEKFANLDFLLEQPLTTDNGTSIAFGSLATMHADNTPVKIDRRNQRYIATVTATTKSEGKYEIASQVQKTAAEVHLLDGVSIGSSAINDTMMEEAGKIGLAILTAIFLVFLVMAIQFNSVRYSAMVMLCIPFSMIGCFSLLFFSQAALSMMAMMGFLMLIGMVVNNGILLVDATNEYRKTLPLEEALIQAGLGRLRPILMTTLTTVLSMLPMVLSNNSGMAMMKGMGFVIIGGLCASTVLALFLMPTFYLCISRK